MYQVCFIYLFGFPFSILEPFHVTPGEKISNQVIYQVVQI